MDAQSLSWSERVREHEPHGARRNPPQLTAFLEAIRARQPHELTTRWTTCVGINVKYEIGERSRAAIREVHGLIDAERAEIGFERQLEVVQRKIFECELLGRELLLRRELGENRRAHRR